MCHSSDKSDVGGSCWGTPTSWWGDVRGAGDTKNSLWGKKKFIVFLTYIPFFLFERLK